jgi:hypothetical protein
MNDQDFDGRLRALEDNLPVQPMQFDATMGSSAQRPSRALSAIGVLGVVTASAVLAIAAAELLPRSDGTSSVGLSSPTADPSGQEATLPVAPSYGPRALSCGAGIGGNHPIAEFDIEHASEIPTIFPGMKRNPDLESDPRPAHVVVFGEGFVLPPTAGIGSPPESASSAVCVVHEGGERVLYPNVSLEGFTPPQTSNPGGE